jgi:hypothetical protein
MRVLIGKTSTYFNFKRRMKYVIAYFLIILLFIIANSHPQSGGSNGGAETLIEDDDLTFPFQDKQIMEDDYVETTKKTTHNNNKRQKMKSRSPQTSANIRTTTMSIPTQTSGASADTTSKITSSHSPSSMSSAPYTYASERLNQTHADIFDKWLDKKSEELYEMTMNFSGYKLLNETYSVKLRGDAGFAWINFTEMIVNISQTISEVLYNKTVIVQNLSDLVEKAFDDFRNQPERYAESASFVYYDSKSPKTFCDVQEKLNPIIAKIETTTPNSTTTNENNLLRMAENYLNETAKATTKKQRKTTSPKAIEKRALRHFEASHFSSPNRQINNPFLDAINQNDYSNLENTYRKKTKKRKKRDDEDTCLYTNIFQKLHKNHHNHFQKNRDKRQSSDNNPQSSGGGGGGGAGGKGRNPAGGTGGQKKTSRRPGTGPGFTGPGQGFTRGK